MASNRYQLYTSVNFSVKRASNELKHLEDSLAVIKQQYEEANKKVKEMTASMGAEAKETAAAAKVAQNLKKDMEALKNAIGVGTKEINILKEGLMNMEGTGPKQVTKLMGILNKAIKNVSGSSDGAKVKLSGLSNALGDIKARMEMLQGGFYSLLEPIKPVAEMTTIELQNMMSIFGKVGANLSKSSAEYKTMGKNVTDAKIKLAEYRGVMDGINTSASSDHLKANISFWQSIASSAEASKEQVKRANQEIANTRKVMADQSMSSLSSSQSMNQRSSSEITASINQLKEYTAQMKLTKQQREEYNLAIQRGEEYLARRAQQDQTVRMLGQLGQGYGNISQLSNKATVEQVKFWQGVRDGANSTKADIQQAETVLRKFAEGYNESKSEKVLAGASMFSTGDIQQAIETTKVLQSTVKDTASWQQMEQAIQHGNDRLRELQNTSKGMALGSQFKNIAEAEKKAQTNLFRSMMQPSSAGIEQLVKDYEALIIQEEKAGRSTEDYKTKVAQLNAILEQRRADEAKTLVQNPLTGTSEEVKKAVQLYSQLAQKEKETGNIGKWQQMTKEIEAANQKLVNYERETKAVRMSEQLHQNTNYWNDTIKLTDQALQEQKKFWQDEMSMTRQGSIEWDTSKAKLQAVNTEIERRAQLQKELNAEQVASKARSVMSDYNHGMGGGSVEQIKENIKLLQQYREQLNPKTDGNVFMQVDQTIRKMEADLRLANDKTLEAKQYLNALDRGKPFKGTIEDLERIKKSLEEYRKGLQVTDVSGLKQVDAALADIDKKQKGVTRGVTDWKTTMSRLNVASYDELKKSAEQLSAELKTMQQNQEGFVEKSKALRDIDKQMKVVNKSFKHHESVISSAASRLKSYVMIYLGFRAIMTRIKDVINSTIELSEKMTNVQKVTGMTTEEIDRMTESLLALDTRVSTDELMTMAEQAGKLGLAVKGGTDAIVDFVKVGQMISSTLGEEIGGAEAIADLLKINDLVNKGTADTLEQQMHRVGSSILDVGNKSKASYADVVNFTRRVGAVGSVAGLSMPQIVALGGTYSSLGASMEQSATAVNRMMIGLNNSTDAIAKAAGVSTKQLREMVESGDTFGALKTVIEAIQDEGLSAVQRVLKAIGGRVNAQLTSALSLLVDNMDVLNQELDYAVNGYEQATTLTQEFDRMNENLAGTLKRIGNEIKEAFVNSGIVEALTKIVQGFVKVVKYINQTPALVGALTAAVVLLTKRLWESRIAWIATINSMTAKDVMMGIVGGIANIIKGLKAAVLAMINFKTTAIAAGTAVKTGFNKASAAVSTFVRANWFTLIIAGIAGVVSWLVKAYKHVDELDKKRAELTSKMEDEIGKAHGLFNSLESLNHQYDEQKKAVNKLTRERDALNKEVEDGAIKDADLKAKEEELEAATNDLNATDNSRLEVMKTINDTYGTTLGYMIDETNQALLLAGARERVVQALKEEAYQKMLNASYEKSVQDNSEDAMDARAGLMTRLKGHEMTKGKEQQFMVELETKVQKVLRDAVSKGQTLTTEEILQQVGKEFEKEGKYVTTYSTHSASGKGTTYVKDVIGNLRTGPFKKDYLEQYVDMIRQIDEQTRDYVDTSTQLKKSADMSKKGTDVAELNGLIKQANKYYRMRRRSAKDDTTYLNILNKAIQLEEKYIDSALTLDKKSEQNLKAMRSQRDSLNSSIARKAQSTLWGQKGTKPENMSIDELKDYYNKLEDTFGAIQSGADYSEIFPDFAVMMQGKDAVTASAAIQAEAEKVAKMMKEKGVTTGGKFKWDNSDPEAEQEKSMKNLRDKIMNEFEAQWKNEEAELAQKYLDGEIGSKVVYDQQLEELKQHRLKDLRQLYAALLSEENTFSTEAYKHISQNEVDLLAHYIAGDGRGKELKDNIHKEMETAVNELRQGEVEIKAEIQQILDENNPFDKLVNEFSVGLLKLRVLVKDAELEGLQVSKQLGAVIKDRTAFLLEESRDAYGLTVESLRKDMQDRGFGDWAAQMTDEELQAILNKLEDFYDTYEEAFRKTTDHLDKLFEMRWKQSETRRKRQIRTSSVEDVQASRDIQQKLIGMFNSRINGTEVGVFSEDSLKRMASKYDKSLGKFVSGMSKKDYKRLNGVISKIIAKNSHEQKYTGPLNGQESGGGFYGGIGAITVDKTLTTDDLKEVQDILKVYKTVVEEIGAIGNSEEKSLYDKYNDQVRAAEGKLSAAKMVEGWYGGAGLDGTLESDKAEIELMQKKIDMGQAYINMVNKEMESRKARAVQAMTDAKAELDAAKTETDAMEDKEEAAAKYRAAETKYSADMANANEEYNLLVRQQETLTAEKMQEVSDDMATMAEAQLKQYTSVIDQLQPYKEALASFGRSFAEAAFGSKEDRQNAAKELIQSVIETTGQVVTQWLVMLATKKIMIQQEILMEQYKQAMITAEQLKAEAQRLGTEAAFAKASMALSEAEGIGKEVAKAGLIGLAIGAAITVAMQALMGVAMGAVNSAMSSAGSSVSTSNSKLKTGMLTYAGGRYPVVGDDGREYDAQYEAGLRTGVYGGGAHFGIFSEKKPEAVIDGDTTEKLMLNYPEIWKDIVSLSKNGGLSPNSAYGNRRMAAYAEGRLPGEVTATGAASADMGDTEIKTTLAALTTTMAALQNQLAQGIGVSIPMFGDGSLNKAIGKMERFKKRKGL